jgi:hypothetical protein
MLIDVQVANGVDLQITGGVPGNEFQHVIQKANAGADPIPPAPIQVQPDANMRLGRSPINAGASQRSPPSR